MELELRRLEDLAESVVNDFAYMRAREEEMRDTNGQLRGILLPLYIYIYHCFTLFPCRVHQLQSTILQCILNVLPSLSCRMADVLSPEILSSQETH